MASETSVTRTPILPPRQELLFEWNNPLAEVMGTTFFRELPQSPGVYIMRDINGQVIYVGQSGNLRKRVSSYKYANPERATRKLMRLVGNIVSIDYEVCPSVTAAKLRENVLLRHYRPRFNRVNTHPESHLFVRLRPFRDGFQLAFSNNLDKLMGLDGNCYYFGAFKGYTLRRAIQALCRLCWIMNQKNPTLYDIPIHLNNYPPPRQLTLSLVTHGTSRSSTGRMKRKMIDFFSGKSETMINKLCGKSNERINQLKDRWLRAILLEDHECLSRFFEFGAARNRKLKKKNKIGPKIVIGQAQLDDLLVDTDIMADFL